MSDQIEHCHVMSREHFETVKARKPAPESTKLRRDLNDEINAIVGATTKRFEAAPCRANPTR